MSLFPVTLGFYFFNIFIFKTSILYLRSSEYHKLPCEPCMFTVFTNTNKWSFHDHIIQVFVRSGPNVMKEDYPKVQAAAGMETVFDGINKQLDFSSCGEEGNSSDTTSDECAVICSPSLACRTPKVQRHRSQSNTLTSSLLCTSPIPYASWKKLRLCDSPSTPKVINYDFSFLQRI